MMKDWDEETWALFNQEHEKEWRENAHELEEYIESYGVYDGDDFDDEPEEDEK